jgi:universal stress protein E
MNKILIVADNDNRCDATPRGLELARKLGWKAEVVGFTYAPLRKIGLKTRDEQTKARQRMLAAREVEVQAQIDKHRQPDEQIKLHLVWEKDIHQWLIKKLARGYGAVVKTVHRTGNYRYTSTDWHLLREAPVPVLIVSDKRWVRTKPILAAVDLTTEIADKRKLNDRIIEQASALANALDSELKLIGAINIPPLLKDLDLVDPASYVRKVREDMKPYIKELAARHELPEKAFRTKRGPVAKVITSEAASVRAQLVVMGTVGHTGVTAKLMGNTAEEVLRNLNTDVMTIK